MTSTPTPTTIEDWINSRVDSINSRSHGFRLKTQLTLSDPSSDIDVRITYDKPVPNFLQPRERGPWNDKTQEVAQTRFGMTNTGLMTIIIPPQEGESPTDLTDRKTNILDLKLDRAEKFGRYHVSAVNNYENLIKESLGKHNEAFRSYLNRL